MQFMSVVKCEHCNIENHFPDDLGEYEECGWCGKEIETGWSDPSDDDDDE